MGSRLIFVTTAISPAFQPAKPAGDCTAATQVCQSQEPAHEENAIYYFVRGSLMVSRQERREASRLRLSGSADVRTHIPPYPRSRKRQEGKLDNLFVRTS